GTPIPVYLRIKNPRIVRTKYDPTDWLDGTDHEDVDKAEERGNDGVIVYGKDGHVTYVVFRADQIAKVPKAAKAAKAATQADMEPMYQHPGGRTGTPQGDKALPSEEADVTPDKACRILHDGTVHGKPLTEAQRGLFGAICGKKSLSPAQRKLL